MKKLSKLSITCGNKILDSFGSNLKLFTISGSHWCARYKAAHSLFRLLKESNVSIVQDKPEQSGDLSTFSFQVNVYDDMTSQKVMSIYNTFK